MRGAIGATRRVFRESLEFPGSVEGTVKFDKEICCALARAFKQNPPVVEELQQLVSVEKLKLFAEILDNTDEMKFVPSHEMRIVYAQIAKREIERIFAEDEDDEDLKCGHTFFEHFWALEVVLEKLQPTLQ